MPLIFIAILLVTVFATELETPVEAKTSPETVGKVSTVVPATACSCSVQLPLVEPNKTIDIIFPYKTTQRLPLGIVTVTPLLIVIGPVLMAFLLVGIV